MSVPQISPSDSYLPNRLEYASVTTSKPYWLAFLVLVVASCTASKPARGFIGQFEETTGKLQFPDTPNSAM